MYHRHLAGILEEAKNGQEERAMPNPFAITVATNTVSLDSKRQGQTTFTVSNTTGRAIRGRAHVVAQPATAEPWVKLLGEAERDFASTGSQQYVVQIAVPPSAPAGDYTFRLDMVDVANPDENFGEGPTVRFVVATPAPVKKPFPWWIVAVVGGLVLVGVIIWLIVPHPPQQDNVKATATAQANAYATATAQANATATALASPLPVPVQVTPANGTVFNQFPRTTTLAWNPVPGAMSYTVKVFFYEPGNTTCTGGVLWKTATDLTSTSYTFDFVGAQPGCWQVQAVNASGRAGVPSPLWEFSYTR